jgi:S1-C subfamily serine protease
VPQEPWRELSALWSGDPDISHLPSEYQAWIRQSCPMSLGPSLCISCIRREMAALESGLPNLSSLAAETRIWLEQSCPYSLGPSLYLSCIRRELSALGVSAAPKTQEKYKTPAHPSPTRTKKVDHIPSFSWPSWKGKRPPMPMTIAREMQSAVNIFRVNSKSVYTIIAGPNENAIRKGTDDVAIGSAVAVSQRHLITNCHIVEGRPVVFLKLGNDFDRVRLLYSDPDTDRCYLKTESLQVIAVLGVRGYSDLNVGEHAYSIGAPAGLEQTLGEGLISGLREAKMVRLIQTSAPISAGSSGGGLFDSFGNLIGITTLFLKESQNLNFAIAAEDFWK